MCFGLSAQRNSPEISSGGIAREQRDYRFFLARFFVLAPFVEDLAFDFFAAFFAGFDLDFFLTLPDVDADLAADFAVFFFVVLPSDFVEPVTDLSALSGVPFRISERIVSTVFATGRLPLAEESPTNAPATPPAMAPIGPPTMPPRTAPVTPPMACLETFKSFSLLAFVGRRVLVFFDFLAMLYFQVFAVGSWPTAACEIRKYFRAVS